VGGVHADSEIQSFLKLENAVEFIGRSHD
jgi:hypothetical protein